MLASDAASWCRENQNTHFMFNNIFDPRKWCCLWDNVENIVRPGRLQMTKRNMRIVRCILKATNTHSEYVIFTAIHCKSGWAKATACYFILSLSYWPLVYGSVQLYRYGPKFRMDLLPWCLHLWMFLLRNFPMKTGVYRTTCFPFPQDSCCHSHQSENSYATSPSTPPKVIHMHIHMYRCFTPCIIHK
jgi:hypothetical protein